MLGSSCNGSGLELVWKFTADMQAHYAIQSRPVLAAESMQHVCTDFADLIWKLHHTLALMHVAKSALETTKSSLQRLLPKSAIKARIAESYSVCKQHGSQRHCGFLLSSSKTQHQVKCRLLLDVVVSQGTSILKLLSSKNQTLLVRRNACKQAPQTNYNV